MTAFLSPLVLALFVAVVSLDAPSDEGRYRGRLLLYTISLAVAELILYITVLMP